MARCQYDAAITSMTVTEERNQLFLFSDPYLAAGQVVVVQASNTDIPGKDNLSGKVVGVQLNATGETQAWVISGTEIRTYEDISLAFQDLLNSQRNAVIAVSPPALMYVGQNPDLLKAADEVLTDEVYAIAIYKSDTTLLDKINLSLATEKAEGLVDEVIEQWIYKKCSIERYTYALRISVP